MPSFFFGQSSLPQEGAPAGERKSIKAPLGSLFSSFSFSISHPSHLPSIPPFHRYHPLLFSCIFHQHNIPSYTLLCLRKVPTSTSSKCSSVSLPTSSLAFASPWLPTLPISPGLLSSWTTLRSSSRPVCSKKTPRPSGALSTSGPGQSESRSMRTSGDFRKRRLCVCFPFDDVWHLMTDISLFQRTTSMPIESPRTAVAKPLAHTSIPTAAANTLHVMQLIPRHARLVT